MPFAFPVSMLGGENVLQKRLLMRSVCVVCVLKCVSVCGGGGYFCEHLYNDPPVSQPYPTGPPT